MATPPLTIASWLQIPQDQRPPFQDPVQRAIQTFTQTFPLDPPHLPDDHHPDSYTGAHSTVILPLWQMTPTLNNSSPHWQAFNAFLDTLAIVAFEAAKALQTMLPNDSRKRWHSTAPGDYVQEHNKLSSLE
ncbi:uncharacterized protein PAC_12068 [Phialocephala subalpina]|uniref:Uncharacterized protein n=1 Tax=Phialocephala subalpina TaxID=576137 RepID=A0A1L7XAX0_9HELO|nr:uncharacterized protein PAC_12068 [Phialocephala subalpina]